MGKNKQNKKKQEIKRRQMIQDVFKKGKKQREIAKKFDEKIAQRQGSIKKLEKFQQIKQIKRRENNANRDLVAALDKRLDELRANRKPGMSKGATCGI